ncbi:MAG: hypothetical protein WC956_04155 [bacterium]
MSPVNSIHYKVNTLGDSGVPEGSAAQTDPGGIDDIFEDSPLSGGKAQTTGTDSSSALDDYNLTGTPGADAPDNSMDAWLSTFPPTLAELIAAKPDIINYLDQAAKKYELAIVDLNTLLKQIDDALASGTLNAAEAQSLTKRRPLAVQSIAKCNEQRVEISKQADKQQATWIQEQKSCKDLNNDHWIGRPNVGGSYYVHTNDDGTEVLVDPISKKAVPPPIIDPEYVPELFASDTMEKITKDQAFGTPKDDAELYLKLKESALQNNNNNFGAPIDIGVPESIWVKRDPEGFADSKAAMDYKDGHQVMQPAEFTANGGIKQNVPDDLSQYVQVQVAKVVVKSEEIGSLSGHPEAKLYNTIVEFQDKDHNIIMRIRIDGFEGSGPAATMLDSGKSYVALSSVGFAMHGMSLNGEGQRVSPVIVDASKYISTGRHILTDTSALGNMTGPGTDQGDRAFNENIGQFTQKSYVSTKWDATKQEWVEEDPKDFDTGEYAYGSYTDRYLGPEDKPPEGSPLKTYATGIFLTGLRGDIKGSEANDLIMTSGVDEFSQYAKDHMPKNLEEMGYDQPMYNNFVDTKTGNDFVVFGKGNNYIQGASAVWGKGLSDDDQNFILLRNQPGKTGGVGTSAKSPNVKNFVHVEGGNTAIYNPDENKIQDTLKKDTTEQITAEDPAMHDDYYEIVGGGTARYGNPGDYDVTDGSPEAHSGSDLEFDIDNGIMGPWTDAHKEWEDEFTKVPDLDGVLEGADLESEMPSSTKNAEDVDAFFGAMFGDYNEAANEGEQITEESNAINQDQAG